MYIVFFSTSDVFQVEELLNEKNIECKIVPTPVTDKAYCGVCLLVNEPLDVDIINDFEYELIEGDKNV